MHIYGTWCRTTGRSLVCSTFYLLARNKCSSRLGTADIPGTSNTPHAKSSPAQLSGCTDRKSRSRSRDKAIFWVLLLLNKHEGLALSWATIKTKLKSETIDENMFRFEIKRNPNRCRYWRINLRVVLRFFRIQTDFYDVAIVIEPGTGRRQSAIRHCYRTQCQSCHSFQAFVDIFQKSIISSLGCKLPPSQFIETHIIELICAFCNEKWQTDVVSILICDGNNFRFTSCICGHAYYGRPQSDKFLTFTAEKWSKM